MKKYFTLLLLIVCFNVQAQEYEAYTKFIIRKACIDGNDCTDTFIENDACLVFYRDESGQLCFANIWQDSRLCGAITPLTYERREETEETYGGNIASFLWHYENADDDKQGICRVEFFTIDTPKAIVFELWITGDDMESVYRGYVDGTLES